MFNVCTVGFIINIQLFSNPRNMLTNDSNLPTTPLCPLENALDDLRVSLTYINVRFLSPNCLFFV